MSYTGWCLFTCLVSRGPNRKKKKACSVSFVSTLFLQATPETDAYGMLSKLVRKLTVGL